MIYYKNIFTNEIITSEEMGNYLFRESKRTGKVVLSDNEWTQIESDDIAFRQYPNKYLNIKWAERLFFMPKRRWLIYLHIYHTE